ncbi:hypothetical protein G6045_01265 [Streptomyces sp. YC504]|uniref:Uncharacterized protein n=1 Tax=Streptomyces mesophilus TaxID=1775132 RepID=A0A6G4XBT3_9ACTN|nr:hypothetical protein [Streptomyces mesophilus]NGO74320.1 hypothetical protein [Streptomyces mesophilus]
MDIGISIGAEADEAELRSLYQWLRDDSHVRRYARVRLDEKEPAPGHMGGDLEGIRLMLESGFQLANFVLAWLAWRGSRPKPPEITVESGGVTVTLSGQDAATAERILAALRTGAPPDPDGP